MNNKKTRGWRCLIAVLALWLMVDSFAVAAVAVLYPTVRAPYDRIFADIIEGIERGARERVIPYALAEEDTDTLIKPSDWLRESGVETVISLGAKGKDIVGSLSAEFSVVVGATILLDDDVSKDLVGISLAPAPGKLFAQLKELAPLVKTLQVVYHPQTNAWLVALAQQEAAAYNLRLVATPARDVREAALLYKKILAENARVESAIWLLQGDPTLDERSLLPMIFSDAWSNNHVVFSSNPSHVKRGALFSLFPNNFRMGVSLSVKARRAANGIDRDIDALEDLLLAVNVRTVEHLGLKITRAQTRQFDLIFPVR